ncbi:uncharacterized protein SAPINGB_P001590 [Magnusiomyces paraingens]|uniref:Heat shock transcription factor n=1 Tax=Magnusiomyces paraingens TaxID=2606893 RepID=A0A5E8B8P1_9ASCO|nr:uncharacterized protein SAPINGB_P001590 [Saprochaete ingens]VVT47195.1 unnamed protein product [Saprochaete ingens]
MNSENSSKFNFPQNTFPGEIPPSNRISFIDNQDLPENSLTPSNNNNNDNNNNNSQLTNNNNTLSDTTVHRRLSDLVQDYDWSKDWKIFAPTAGLKSTAPNTSTLPVSLIPRPISNPSQNDNSIDNSMYTNNIYSAKSNGISQQPQQQPQQQPSPDIKSVTVPTMISSDLTHHNAASGHKRSASKRLTTGKSRRGAGTGPKNRPAFVLKLWNMVNDKGNEAYIQWTPDGESFQVLSREQFEKIVLPKYFKHSNFSSFVRQLNMYGWHKVQDVTSGAMQSSDETWQFKSPNFVRGREDLLDNIVRNKGSKGSDDEEEGEFNKLLDELEFIKSNQVAIADDLSRIRKDNELLWRECYESRERHKAHTETFEKILRFLASLYTTNQGKFVNDASNVPGGHKQPLLLLPKLSELSPNDTTNTETNNATLSAIEELISSGNNDKDINPGSNFTPSHHRISSIGSIDESRPIITEADTPNSISSISSPQNAASIEPSTYGIKKLSTSSVSNNNKNNKNNNSNNNNSLGSPSIESVISATGAGSPISPNSIQADNVLSEFLPAHSQIASNNQVALPTAQYPMQAPTNLLSSSNNNNLSNLGIPQPSSTSSLMTLPPSLRTTPTLSAPSPYNLSNTSGVSPAPSLASAQTPNGISSGPTSVGGLSPMESRLLGTTTDLDSISRNLDLQGQSLQLVQDWVQKIDPSYEMDYVNSLPNSTTGTTGNVLGSTPVSTSTPGGGMIPQMPMSVGTNTNGSNGSTGSNLVSSSNGSDAFNVDDFLSTGADLLDDSTQSGTVNVENTEDMGGPANLLDELELEGPPLKRQRLNKDGSPGY